jgi:hypothetical protein
MSEKMHSGDFDSDIARAQEYRFRPLTEAVVVGLIFFAAIFVTTFFVYHHALQAQKGEIRDGLVRTGELLANFIDSEQHNDFRSRDQKTSAAYLQAVEPLRKTIEADDTIPFAYTTVLKNDKVYFVLDLVPANSPDAVGIMEEYVDASAELREALRDNKITTSQEPYTDEWGSFISGHIPLTNAEGNAVGVLSIDIDATAYFERLAPIKRATIRAMVTAFFISYLIAALVWFMRNFSCVINNKRLLLVRNMQRGPDAH